MRQCDDGTQYTLLKKKFKKNFVPVWTKTTISYTIVRENEPCVNKSQKAEPEIYTALRGVNICTITTAVLPPR